MIFGLEHGPLNFLELRVLSQLYGDKKTANFPDKVEGKNKKSIPDISEENRLVFLGHSSGESFGRDDFTPEEFADKLIAMGLNKEKKGVTIDLLGCSIGDLSNDTSYAKQVAQYLYNKGYSNVRVNALNELVANNPESIKRTYLGAPTGFSSILSFNTRLFGSSEKSVKRIDNIKNKFLASIALVFNSKYIYSTRNIKSTFDHNENLQITKDNIDIPYEKRLFFAPLNNRIARLKEEKELSKLSKVAKYSKIIRHKTKLKDEKIEALEALREELKKAPIEQYEKLINNASHNVSSRSTYRCLEQMKVGAKKLLVKANQRYEAAQSNFISDRKAALATLKEVAQFGSEKAQDKLNIFVEEVEKNKLKGINNEIRDVVSTQYYQLLEGHPYYSGRIDKDIAANLLNDAKEGTFLIRYSENKSGYFLTIKKDSGISSYRLNDNLFSYLALNDEGEEFKKIVTEKFGSPSQIFMQEPEKKSSSQIIRDPLIKDVCDSIKNQNDVNIYRYLNMNEKEKTSTLLNLNAEERKTFMKRVFTIMDNNVFQQVYPFDKNRENRRIEKVEKFFNKSYSEFVQQHNHKDAVEHYVALSEEKRKAYVVSRVDIEEVHLLRKHLKAFYKDAQNYRVDRHLSHDESYYEKLLEELKSYNHQRVQSMRPANTTEAPTPTHQISHRKKI